MGLRRFWHNYKVLIVMGTSLGLIHGAWYFLKTSPALRKKGDDYIPEPGIVAFVAQAPPPPPQVAQPSPGK